MLLFRISAASQEALHGLRELTKMVAFSVCLETPVKQDVQFKSQCMKTAVFENTMK